MKIIFFFFCLSFLIVNAEKKEDVVEVKIVMKPYPQKSLSFLLQDSTRTSYTFSLPLNETQKMSQFSCKQKEKEINVQFISKEEKERMEIIVELQPNEQQEEMKFECQWNMIDSLLNYPKVKDVDDPYKFLTTISLCPISSQLKCRSSILKVAHDTISMSIKPKEETSSKITFKPMIIEHEDEQFTFVVYHFSTRFESMTFSSVKKVININKNDHYVHMEIEDMKNNGAQLEKEFFRSDFRRGGVFLSEIKMNVEKESSNLEYRDTTGLITTGRLIPYDKHVTLQLPTRYPLLGGWKTSFEVNYNYPYDISIQQINTKKRFITPLKIDLNGIVTKSELEIVLPEGATITSIHYPKQHVLSEEIYNQKSFGTTFTKPVVKLTFDHVDLHSLPGSIEIYYEENPVAEKTKNIIVACLASSIILIIILYAKIINN